VQVERDTIPKKTNMDYYLNNKSEYQRPNQKGGNNVTNSSYNSNTADGAEGRSFKNEIISEKIGTSLNNSNNKNLDDPKVASQGKDVAAYEPANKKDYPQKQPVYQPANRKNQIIQNPIKNVPHIIHVNPDNGSPIHAQFYSPLTKHSLRENQSNSISTSNDYMYNDKDQVIILSDKPTYLHDPMESSEFGLGAVLLNNDSHGTPLKEFLSVAKQNSTHINNTGTVSMNNELFTDLEDYKSKLLKSLEYSKNGNSDHSMNIEDYKKYVLINNGNIV
jgi:hypothetical protein